MIESEKRVKERQLIALLSGCGGCEYDEADGALFNHCNACCRKITAAAWDWANTPERKRTRKKK